MNTWHTLTHLLNDKITGQQITSPRWLSSDYTVPKVSGGCWNSTGECWHNKKELNRDSITKGNKKAPLTGTPCPLASFSMFAIKSCLCELWRKYLVSLSLLSLFHFHYLWLIYLFILDRFVVDISFGERESNWDYFNLVFAFDNNTFFI